MRKTIKTAIKSAFAQMFPQYQFRTGFITDIGAGGFDLPCVWLCPADLVGLKGRHEGQATYAVIIYLFRTKEGVEPDGRDDVWDEMEAEARTALNAIVDEDIRCVESIKAEADENAYTGFGELSLKVSFLVMVDFCDERK